MSDETVRGEVVAWVIEGNYTIASIARQLHLPLDQVSRVVSLLFEDGTLYIKKSD